MRPLTPRLPIPLLLIALPLVAQAGPSLIYKCRSEGVIQYQSVPCEGASAVDRAPIAVRRSAVDASSDGIGEPDAGFDASGSWLHGGELAPGVTDTVALNHPGWGRPQAIKRMRASDGFREVWTYAASIEGRVRVLRFLNGRLMAIDEESVPVVSIEPASRGASVPDAIASAMPRIPHGSVRIWPSTDEGYVGTASE